ncbi:YsnF/AvaK domain-containing protein [Leptolyngbya sp. DQ-M1]|uniref:YsnF/AvaK domain-containing protein n=1 Tax=Leptolyngbya sp. DQ-M1 TaxID=2933920 RepID=UPI003298335D
MALHKIKDFDPDYRTHFDNNDVIGFDVYSGNEKVGSVDDVLVDDDGSFRYLVINTGLWILGKKVLMPIAQGRIAYPDHRVYANSLTKAQVESLPTYDPERLIDYDHEEQVRGVYRPTTAAMSADMTYDRSSYGYDRDPDLYGLDNDQTLRLYQERLIASKTRQKTGEVTVGKHTETETARVSVPIEKERVVIERTPVMGGMPVTVGEADFHEGEVARVEVYEEVADIQKEAFVREEVRVKKVVDHDVVTAEDQIRREEVDLNVDGTPIVEKKL